MPGRWIAPPASRVLAFVVCRRAFLRGLEGLCAETQTGEKGTPQMALYEHVYMARQDVSAQQVETLTDSFKSVVEGLGGKFAKVEYWGVKSLAFRIKKNRKAHFTLLNIDAPPAAISEMERQMGLNEDILRFITIRVDAHEDGPSAMMRKRDDDDRGDRRGPRGDRPPRRPREDAPQPSEEGAN